MRKYFALDFVKLVYLKPCGKIMVQRILSFVLLLFLANSALASTFATDNVDAEFDVCMDAWKTGNVIWNSARGNEIRVFVHKNDRIFDIEWSESIGLYVCREKKFFVKEPDLPKTNEQPIASAVVEAPLEFDSFDFHCNKSSALVLSTPCKGKGSDYTLLSIRRVLKADRLVKIKGQTLFGSGGSVVVEAYFMPEKNLDLVNSLIWNQSIISCSSFTDKQEDIQALADLKQGKTYTITGNVKLVQKGELQLTNCRFELE